jgi:hypothetical protein
MHSSLHLGYSQSCFRDMIISYIIQVCWCPETGQGRHTYLRSYCGKLVPRGGKAHFMYVVPVGSQLPGQERHTH